MRAFVAVAREGAFTRAADRLSMSPQLVSKYVAGLEKRLGARLLNRTTRRVNLTEAGMRYYQGALQLLDDYDDLENQLGDLQDEARGLLRISAPVSFAGRHLGVPLCAFQERHPGVGIDLQLNDRRVDIVDEGFDIALRIGHLKSSSLVARRIATVRLVICASPHYLARHGTPASLADLEQHRYLRYAYMDSDNRETAYAALFMGRHRHREFVCNNGDVLVQATVEGAGIAIQPTFIAGDAIARGDLQVILPELAPEPLGLYIVYASRQLLASKIRAFIDFMDGYYGDPPYWDDFATATG